MGDYDEKSGLKMIGRMERGKDAVDTMMDNKYGPDAHVATRPGNEASAKENYYIKGNNAKVQNDGDKSIRGYAYSDEAKKPTGEIKRINETAPSSKWDKTPPQQYSHVFIPNDPTRPADGETYAKYQENGFEYARTTPLSTFSADVDTASFSNVRRFLNSNQLPPTDAVRIEELVNYFKYNVETLKTEDPFGLNVEAVSCPWNAVHRLVRVTIKAKGLPENRRPASNLVFLIDVSGSMDAPNRLPLVKDGLKALVRQLGENDRVAIVTYAGESGVALPSTNCTEKERILSVIDSLHAAGSTNGGAGIQTAYATAKENFIKGGVNRVILATDGDFNVGISNPNELVAMIETLSGSGVFLTALGYGMGNLKDAMLQRLADKGNGNYAYIDTAEESRKVLIEQMHGTLVTVAKDVKFQVEFNPAQTDSYRLIGYEKRALAAQDFNNDAKDAGEVGAGHTVTAFYEIAPTNRALQTGIDPLKYQTRELEPATPPVAGSPELFTLKIRYKMPEGQLSKRLEFAFTDKGAGFEQASADFKFASAVALFGQILKQSAHIQNTPMRRVIELADDSRGADEGGYRREFIQLARKAMELRGER
jgi:Ca-activated chloride channel family protein